ncbi:kinase-like protein [Tothia fuscella]|uniref:Kinase-like protein n=1 Tax=Tothia fuscella TaxID=1048955 RepID=A0A9P4NRF3_9PEZI|nr:kinase-like protein [Tothia fuscella]
MEDIKDTEVAQMSAKEVHTTKKTCAQSTRSCAQTMDVYTTKKKLDVDLDVEFLTDGGYNTVWLVRVPEQLTMHYIPSKFVLRIPKPHSLFPYQLQNEVGFLKLLKSKHPEIPVPALYAHSDDIETPFIAMEYIDGKPASAAWRSLSEPDKAILANNIAKILVAMLDVRSPFVGNSMGVETSSTHISTMMSVLIPQCKPTSPPNTTRRLSTILTVETISTWSGSRRYQFPFFLDTLRQTRAIVADLEDPSLLPAEPYGLVHGDFEGRNVLVNGTSVVAVIDWEFANFLPLGVSKTPEILSYNTEEDYEEDLKWQNIIRDLAAEMCYAKKWPEREVRLMLSGGNPMFQRCRSGCYPQQPEETDQKDSDVESLTHQEEGSKPGSIGAPCFAERRKSRLHLKHGDTGFANRVPIPKHNDDSTSDTDELEDHVFIEPADFQASTMQIGEYSFARLLFVALLLGTWLELLWRC